MKHIEQWRWWLPRSGGRKPYLSRWHMTEEEARRRGAIRHEPTSRMVVRVAETGPESDLVRLSTDTSPGAVGRARLARLGSPVPLLELPVRAMRWLDDFNRPWGSGFPG